MIIKPTFNSSPELPKLLGEIMLEVYTHKSVKTASTSTAVREYDSERLALLGKSALDMAVTYVLFAKRPFQSAEDLAQSRDYILSDHSIEKWVTDSGMLDKTISFPDDPEERRFLFHSYIGALFVQSGIDPIQNWMSGVIDPDSEPPLPPSPPGSHQQLNPPAYQTGPRPSFSPHPPLEPAPVHPPPPPDTMQMHINHLPTPPANNAVTVALVNQIASQKACKIEYVAESVGPPHQPIWTVRCKINSIEKGMGRGKNQKIAREEAARQTYFAMNWG